MFDRISLPSSFGTFQITTKGQLAEDWASTKYANLEWNHQTYSKLQVNRMARPRDIIKPQGWITPKVIQTIELCIWLSSKLIGYRRSADETADAIRNAMRVDTFVVICLLVESLCFVLVAFGAWTPLRILAFLICGWRVVDLFATAVRLALFKFALEAKGAVASYPRIVVLGLINYIEISVCFAVFYAAVSNDFQVSPAEKWDWFSPLYFSAVTQLTIGYGDLSPTGLARLLAVIQAFVGVVLIVLLVSRFVSVMKVTPSYSDPRNDQGE